MDLIRGALESLDSVLSRACRYEPSYSYDFRQKLVEGLKSCYLEYPLKTENIRGFLQKGTDTCKN